MITFGDTTYRLALLDTNAVSTFVTNREAFKHYMEWSLASPPNFVPAFSMFTVIELRHRPAVYNAFKETFSVVPCVVLKSFDLLLADEVASSPSPSDVDPCLHAFGGSLSRAGLGDVFDALFASAQGRADERRWNAARPEIVEGIASLVSNYLPEGATYTPPEVRTFIQVAGFQQIAMRQWEFAEHVVASGGEVDIDAFPSVKAATITVFHEFHSDRNRQPTDSDAYDIEISSATPYVDATVTEANQAEALRKTKRRDDFISGVSVFTLRDFRNAPSSAIHAQS